MFRDRIYYGVVQSPTHPVLALFKGICNGKRRSKGDRPFAVNEHLAKCDGGADRKAGSEKALQRL